MPRGPLAEPRPASREGNCDIQGFDSCSRQGKSADDGPVVTASVRVLADLRAALKDESPRLHSPARGFVGHANHERYPVGARLCYLTERGWASHTFTVLS
jgi:hypothetical protein